MATNWRGLIIAAACCSGWCIAQDNTRDSSGFSLPRENEAFSTALEDFKRYSDKKQWDAAFKAISKATETPLKGFTADDSGICLPSAQRIATLLQGLPPEGVAAYRLFYDASGKQAFQDAAGAGAKDIVPLRKAVDQFFLTSSGPAAADRLGDAEFEAGDFGSAARRWQMILDHFPDSPIPPARLQAKIATAEARLGHWDRVDQIAKSAADHSETVQIGGQTLSLADYLTSLRASATQAGPATQPSDQILTGLPGSSDEAWQSVFMDPATSDDFHNTLSRTGWWRFMTAPDTTIPAAAADSKRVYVNWMGIVFAVDLQSGKLLWRTSKFSVLRGQAMMLLQSGFNVGQLNIATDGKSVLATVGSVALNGNNSPVQNGNGSSLQCLDAETGKSLWSTRPGPLGEYNFVGSVVLNNGVIYAVAAKGQSGGLDLLAIEPQKGALLWQTPLGTPVTGSDFRSQRILPSPAIRIDGDRLWVLTNNGALLAIDTVSHSVRWGIRTEAPEISNREQMFISDETPTIKIEPPGFIDFVDGVLYAKEKATSTLYAIDPTGPTILWKRPLEKELSVARVRNGQLVVIGNAAEAIDASTHGLLWSTPLPVQTGQMSAVFGGNRMIVHGGRGLYVVDTDNGDTVNIFRGADTDAVGSNLLLGGGKLIAVSNRAITAYDLPQPLHSPQKAP